MRDTGRSEGVLGTVGIWCGAVLLVGACVSCKSYPERTAAALADFEQCRLEEALRRFEDPQTTGCPFLRGAEAGMVALAAGDWDAALENLNRAAEVVEEIERQALISPESLGQTLVTWTINETMRKYPGEGYERVLVHAGLAMTYLALGEPEDARVEVRRANALLESEEKLYSTSYSAGGLGHFMSAVSYELEDDLDDAYIDYRRMVEKDVGLELAGKALVRLARRLDRQDELLEWERRFGPAEELPDGAASVVVIAGIGLGPRKREVSLTLPLPDGTVRWAVPEYVPQPQPVARIALSVAGSDLGVRTVVVEDVTSVAQKNLQDRLGWLAARSAVRAWLKYELSEELADRYDAIGWLAGLAFAVATEQADLRSWQTLPGTWQAARLFLPSGRHDLVLAAEGGEVVSLGAFELEPRETMFVLARTIGPRLVAHVVGGLSVPAQDQPVTLQPEAASGEHGGPR